MANDMFNKFATTPLTGFGPDPRSFWDITPLLKTQAMWQQNIIDANKKYDNTIAEISKSTDPTNLLKNLNSSNLSSSARKQTDSIENQLKKAEEERKKAEKERKAEEEKKRKKLEEDFEKLSGKTKKTEQEIIKLENAKDRETRTIDGKITTKTGQINKLVEEIEGKGDTDKAMPHYGTDGVSYYNYAENKKDKENLEIKKRRLERYREELAELEKRKAFINSDYYENHYRNDVENYKRFKEEVLGEKSTSSPASQQEEMPEEIKEVINGTTETKQKSNGKKEKLPQSENFYDLTTEEGKKRALEDRKKEPKKQQSKLSEYEETHRDLVEKSKADPNGVYIIDINNPNFLNGGKKLHTKGDRIASNRIEDLPNGTVVAYQGEVIRITGGDKIYGLETRKPKYDTPYEANTGNARSQKAQQDEIINSLPAITKQVEVDDKGYIIPDGDARSGTGTITEVEDSLSNYADIGSAEWEEMGDMERKDKAQEFLNYFGKRLLEAQKENPEVFTNEKIRQLLAEKKAQFDENIRLYLKENSDNLAEDVGNVARDLAISTINFFDEGMAGIADVFGMNSVAEFFYRGAEDVSEFKSKEQKRKDKNYQYLKAKYEKQFGNGLIDGAKAAILAADESDNLLNTLRDSLVPSLLFMGGTAGSLAKGSGFVAKNASKISTVGVMGISGAGSAGAEVRTIKDLALRDENSFNNFLEAYKKKNGEKAYNALIESATKNGRLDKEELFNILQSKAARIGGALSATVGLISSSLGGDVETGLINRFVLGNAAARGAVGKLTAFKLAGNIASSMANEGAEEAAETMSQNIALRFTADPDREITEGVGEATALGMAGGVIGGTLEYMGDRSARREQQRLEQQQNQDQNQQTDDFEVEDNPPQLTEREQLEQLNDPNIPVQEETEQKEQEEEQKKIEEQKKLEQEQKEEEEEKKEERLRKQYKRLFEPKGSFEEWIKDAEETIDTERQVKAIVDNLTDAQVREEIQWLFDNYIDNEEVLGHLSEDERKQFNEMLKTQFGLNTNPFVIVSEPTEAEKFWTTNENLSGVSPDIINAMAVDDGVAQNLNINADDEAYFQHMANVLNNTLVNNEEWNKATNTNERRAVLQKALDAELKDAQDIDEDKKNEMRLILSMELLANGAREFDKQNQQTEQEEAKPVEIEDHLGKKEETPKQTKSDGRKQETEEEDNSLPPKLSDEDMLTLNGLTLKREKEIRDIVDKIPLDRDFIQRRANAHASASKIAEEMLGGRFLQYANENAFAINLLEEKIKDVLLKKSNGKKQETKQTKSDGIKQTDGEFTAEDVANHSSEALTAYRQSGLPKAGKAIKDNTIAKYLNMSDEDVSSKLNKQYGKKRGAERKALLDQIKEEIRSKKNGQQTNATENTGQSKETGGERTGEEEQRGSGLVNDEQGTTGDAGVESVGDTSQGQSTTESNQTDLAREDANSTGGTTDQTGQGENTLNKGSSSEIEDDNRQAESERDTDKKSKGRKSTKSTDTKSKKNTTGGRKSRTEETERNSNDRGGETVAEEGIETFNPQNVIEKTSPNLADYQKENLLTYFNIVNNNKELANYLAEVLVEDVKNNTSETAKQIYRKVINQLPNTFVDEDRIRAFKAGYGIPARSDGIQGLVVANKDNSESETYKTWKALVNDELSKNPNEEPIKVLENVAVRILNSDITLAAEKTARQQLNDFGFDDNEIDNLTADLTNTLNEDEVKKAARKKGIRANKKLDEVVELFNQDIRDRIDSGDIKFSLTSPDPRNSFLWNTTPSELRQEIIDTFGAEISDFINIYTIEEARTIYGNEADYIQGVYHPDTGEIDIIVDKSVKAHSLLGTVFHELAHAVIDINNDENIVIGDSEKREAKKDIDRGNIQTAIERLTSAQISEINLWFNKLQALNNNKWIKLLADFKKEQYKDIIEKRKKSDFYNTEYGRLKADTTHIEEAFVEFYRAYKTNDWSKIEEQIGEEIPKQYKERNEVKNPIIKLFNEFKDLLFNIFQKFYKGNKDVKITDDMVLAALGEIDTNLFGEGRQGFINQMTAKQIQASIDEEFDDDGDTKFSLRTDPPPKKTQIGYKAFDIDIDKKTGKVLGVKPAKVADGNTPLGVWLDADAAEYFYAPKRPTSKADYNRMIAENGGKPFTDGKRYIWGSDGKALAYRPGWHFTNSIDASQFNKDDKETGRKGALFPNNKVWAEIEYAADRNYYENSDAETKSKIESKAGLDYIPENGYYPFTTNQKLRAEGNEEWGISGAIKINRFLTRGEEQQIRAEQAENMSNPERKAILSKPIEYQAGDLITDEVVNELNRQIQEIQNENDATLRNDEQQGYLGGNQSAETRGANDNQENSTQYNDTTSNEPTRNGNGKTRQRKAQKQKIIKSITGFNGEINDNQSTADPVELKASIENELRNTFGEETAGQVQVMTLEELRKTQPKTADSVEKNNVRGFYKPKSGQVIIIADHFAGLSPKEASLVAFHELGHKTMGAKRAEWDNELARLSSNKTISKIKDKLKQIEGYKKLNDVELTEEVMADLFAAYQSSDWNSFTDKYGVEFSKELTGETRTLYERFKDFIKNFFGYGENEQVSDREVRAALGKLSLEFNGETEADLNSQEKSIADVNSYIEQVRNGQAQDERISALVEQGLSDEDIVKDLFGELADADAEGKTYKTNLPENISNAIQNAWNGIKNTVSTVALGSSIWVGTNLGMSQDAMAQDFNYSNPVEFESQVVKKIVDTNDHLGETFAVVNKQNGSLTIYDRNGNQIATTPALYGKKVGDTFSQNSKGITPSGRFNLEYTTNINNKAYGKSAQILTQNGKWLGNNSGNFAIHRTYTGFPNENRPARLASKTPADNKISLGCINVPPEFYDAHFENNQFGNMPLYVLPETPAGRTGIFSNQPTQKKESISGDPETDEILRKYNVKNKGNPAKNKPYTNDYMENVNPFATAQAVSSGEVKNAELEGLTSTYKELNQINIGDSIAQDPTDRQDVLTTGFKDGLSSASMVTYNYGKEPDFNEETEDDPRLTPSERLANGDFDSMPIQRGVREDSTEDDDIYKASIGIVGGLEIALATKGVVSAVKTTQKRKSTGAKKLLPSQAPNQQYIDNRRKAWQNYIRKVSNDIDPETIDKTTGIGKNWTQARLDELADLYFNIDDFSDSLFDATSYIQSRTSDFDNHRTWGNNKLLRWVFKTFGGATPAFDNALGRQNIKRFGYEADSAIPSVHFARIKALTNGAMGHLQRSYLRPLHRQTEYLAQDLGKSTKQIRQDAGELATIDHILDEGADHFFRGLDLAIQEAKGKYGNLLNALKAAANAGNIRKYDKIDAQMKQLNEEIRKARIERVRSYRVYKGKDPDNGQTLLPGGYTEQMLNDKRTELQNNYGNDFNRLKKHSDEIVDITQKVRNFGATNGVFGADSLNTIQKLGFTNYVPLYTNPTENENLELDFDKSPFELLNELTQRTTNDILNLGVSSNVLKNILGNGTTRDFTSFGRSGSTSEKQALNAYENLETFAQKIAARTGTIPFAQSVQQLFEGTVGESMQTVNKRLNFAEFNSKQRLDANGNPILDANGNPEMENMTMRGGNSKFKGLIRFPSDMSNDWKQLLTREEIRQLEQDLGMKPGKLGTPSQLKSRLASLQPIRGKGYNADGELKNYDYYFIEPDVSNEINQSFNHLARTRLTDGRGFISDIMGAGTKLESKLMTSYNLVWNAVNFTRDSLERWSIMLNRPVKDMNGNLISKWDLTKTYENNIAKLIGSPTEAMPEIYRYLTENEVKTELQRQLQEAVRGGGIQLMNDLLRKDSSILLDNKNEVIEKVLKHMEHWTNTGVNKIGGGGIRNTLKEVNASYIAAFVEIPQVISALAAYQTYQQLGVNKQESLNRTRDMFDPLRTRNNLVSGASKFYPFVRATLSGHYNLIRTLTQYWKPGERGWMTGYLLGGTATAYAFYALAAGFMGDDDDGIPKIAKMSIQQLMQGIPIPAYKKGFFSFPTGFGINKIFSSLAAILFKYNHGQLSRGDAFKASLDLIFENTTPMKPVHSRDNSILKSISLTFAPYLFKTAFESSFGQRSNGSTLYKVQKKLGQKKHQIDDFTVPDKYKSLAKTLHDWSGGFLDFNPETLELFADNVFQGPLKVIPQNLMQDRAEKTLGHETSKGEFIGLALNLIGAGILSSPTAFEDYNFIHAFQRLRVGILETFNIDETGKTMMDENGTLITDAKALGLDATENTARRLAAKGASREVINFVVNNRNFTKIRNDLQRDLRHYLNIHNRHTDPKVRAMAKEQAEDLWNRIEGLNKFYIKNEGRSWYELLSEFNEGGLNRQVLQSPY